MIIVIFQNKRLNLKTNTHSANTTFFNKHEGTLS